MDFVKSNQRVADHGEVFTPAWLVAAMLDLVKAETERIDSRFLEPACGSGNFLVQILRRKLAAVALKFGTPIAGRLALGGAAGQPSGRRGRLDWYFRTIDIPAKAGEH